MMKWDTELNVESESMNGYESCRSGRWGLVREESGRVVHHLACTRVRECNEFVVECPWTCLIQDSECWCLESYSYGTRGQGEVEKTK
jgi:hypothetical protein